MKYIEVLLGWDAINICIFFVAVLIKFNLNHFLIYFFIGHFLILMFGMVEAIRKDKGRRLKCNTKLM